LLINNKGVKISIVRLEENHKREVPDLVAREKELTIIVNQKKLITLNCSPGNYKYLGVGFLFTTGILLNKQDIISIKTNRKSIDIEVKNPSWLLRELSNISSIVENQPKDYKLSKSHSKVPNSTKVSYRIIYKLINEMQEKASLFKLTGGVHSCALADTYGTILLFSEDISRYNTIDRILGEALLKDINSNDKVMLTSCRITSGIIKKIINGNIPIVISRAAVTDSAVRMADLYCITLIGFTRGKRMNIYSHPERITL
jgi:FdhD protein